MCRCFQYDKLQRVYEPSGDIVELHGELPQVDAVTGQGNSHDMALPIIVSANPDAGRCVHGVSDNFAGTTVVCSGIIAVCSGVTVVCSAVIAVFFGVIAVCSGTITMR